MAVQQLKDAPVGVAENVKRLRERRALSQEDLAKLAGVAPNTIWRVETGGTYRPSTVRKLAEALKVDVEVLTADESTDRAVSAG